MSAQQAFTVRISAERHAALKLIADVLATPIAALVRTAIDDSVEQTFNNPTFREQLDRFHADELRTIERWQSP